MNRMSKTSALALLAIVALATAPAMAADIQYTYPVPSGTAWPDGYGFPHTSDKVNRSASRLVVSEYPTGKGGQRVKYADDGVRVSSNVQTDCPLRHSYRPGEH